MPTSETGRFVGEFEVSVDKKRWITLPGAWRVSGDDEPDHFLVRLHPEGCLEVLSPARIEMLVARIEAMAPDPDTMAAIQKSFATADTAECDGGGRLTLQRRQLELARISTTALLIGTGLDFQIWNTILRGGRAL